MRRLLGTRNYCTEPNDVTFPHQFDVHVCLRHGVMFRLEGRDQLLNSTRIAIQALREDLFGSALLQRLRVHAWLGWVGTACLLAARPSRKATVD